MRVAISLKQGPYIQSDEGHDPGFLSYQVDNCLDLGRLPGRRENVLDRSPADWTEEPWPKGSEWPGGHMLQSPDRFKTK